MSAFQHLHRSLPRSPDLEHLREEAKTLKQLCASRDADALQFVAFHKGVAADAVKLADAQFALARAYGYRSWPRLKAWVEAQSRTPEQRAVLLLDAGATTDDGESPDCGVTL
jgi:hypothetical protein